jgi:NAD(P)-dependent dehydrogenase (short-subunit alcohol dehydrogenase family)
MLKNKNIVVIGGTTGIGLSAAKAFIRNGCRVVVVGRNRESCEKAREALGDHGKVISGDASDENVAPSAIEACISLYGGFHGLYHVAGGSGRAAGDGPTAPVVNGGVGQDYRDEPHFNDDIGQGSYKKIPGTETGRYNI